MCVTATKKMTTTWRTTSWERERKKKLLLRFSYSLSEFRFFRPVIVFTRFFFVFSHFVSFIIFFSGFFLLCELPRRSIFFLTACNKLSNVYTHCKSVKEEEAKDHFAQCTHTLYIKLYFIYHFAYKYINLKHWDFIGV